MDVKQKVNFVPAGEAVRVAYAALNTLQAERPEHQVVGLAVLFTVVSAELGISPSELINKAERMVAHNDTFFQREVKALRDYTREELKK